MSALTRIVLLPVAATLLLTVRMPAQTKPARPQLRSVFVRVLDSNGGPIAGLAAADFDVTEGGTKREVVKAGPAASPMRIAVLADTSDGATAALNHLRTGLVAFADAVAPPHELMLVTTGRQTRVRLSPTADRKKFKDAASALFSDGGATPLMDTILDVDDRFLRKADDRWPAFVIVTGDGTESSNGASENKFNDWVRALPARGIVVHAIVLKYHGGGIPEIVAGHVAATAAGMYDYMNTSNPLPDKLKAIAGRLTSDYERASAKYEVSFAADNPTGPVMVGVAREGVRVETTQTRLR
jgi:hypothetical protein